MSTGYRYSSSRPSPSSPTSRSMTGRARRVAGAAILLGSVSLLSACGGGSYGYASGPQYGGPADVNCQFGTPCGNARGTRP